MPFYNWLRQASIFAGVTTEGKFYNVVGRHALGQQPLLQIGRMR